MNRGKLITIEGSEGAGKSTAIKFIQNYFAKLKIATLLTREPGGTEIAEQIRQVLLHHKSTEAIQPLTELLLMFAGRMQHIHQCILPALHAGTWVISDRYIDASYAYQGGGREIPLETIKLLDKVIVSDLYPDLTLLLDLPVDLGLKRTEKRGEQKDRIEQEKLAFFVRVREAYLKRAADDPKRIKIIDASQPLAEVEAQIHKLLDAFLQSLSVARESKS